MSRPSKTRSYRYRYTLQPRFRRECADRNDPCWLCGQPIDYTITSIANLEAFELDHYWPVSTHPQHADDPANFRPSHKLCNIQRGNTQHITTLGPPSDAFI